jgi:hypothetical protein
MLNNSTTAAAVTSSTTILIPVQHSNMSTTFDIDSYGSGSAAATSNGLYSSNLLLPYGIFDFPADEFDSSILDSTASNVKDVIENSHVTDQGNQSSSVLNPVMDPQYNHIQQQQHSHNHSPCYSHNRRRLAGGGGGKRGPGGFNNVGGRMPLTDRLRGALGINDERNNNKNRDAGWTPQPDSYYKKENKVEQRGASGAGAEAGVVDKAKVHHMSFLDLHRGVASTQYLVQSQIQNNNYADAMLARLSSSGISGDASVSSTLSSTSTSTSSASAVAAISKELYFPTELHERTWFASGVDDVIVGRLTCMDILKEEHNVYSSSVGADVAGRTDGRQLRAAAAMKSVKKTSSDASGKQSAMRSKLRATAKAAGNAAPASSLSKSILASTGSGKAADGLTGSGGANAVKNSGGVSGGRGRGVGCLNVAMQLTREKGRDMIPNVDIAVRDKKISVRVPTSTSTATATATANATTTATTISSTSATNRDGGEVSYMERQYRGMGLLLYPSNAAVIPHTYMCVAMRCVTGKAASTVNARYVEVEVEGGIRSMEKDGIKSTAFTCEGAEEAEIFVAIEKEDTVSAGDAAIQQATQIDKGKETARKGATTAGGASGASGDPKADAGYRAELTAQLASQCWGRIEAAAQRGYNSLLERHTTAFAEKMNRVDLSIGTTSTSTSTTAATTTAEAVGVAMSGSSDVKEKAAAKGSRESVARTLMGNSESGSTAGDSADGRDDDKEEEKEGEGGVNADADVDAGIDDDGDAADAISEDIHRHSMSHDKYRNTTTGEVTEADTTGRMLITTAAARNVRGPLTVSAYTQDLARGAERGDRVAAASISSEGRTEQLIVSVYQFSRYLLLSSGTKAAVNLQVGITLHITL